MGVPLTESDRQDVQIALARSTDLAGQGLSDLARDNLNTILTTNEWPDSGAPEFPARGDEDDPDPSVDPAPGQDLPEGEAPVVAPRKKAARTVTKKATPRKAPAKKPTRKG